MCGIVGVFNLHRAERVDPALVERMRDTMPHRGPDGVGLWTDPEGQVALGGDLLVSAEHPSLSERPLASPR